MYTLTVAGIALGFTGGGPMATDESPVESATPPGLTGLRASGRSFGPIDET